jgi:thiol-disulfide isomerase/thioredoxin
VKVRFPSPLLGAAFLVILASSCAKEKRSREAESTQREDARVPAGSADATAPAEQGKAAAQAAAAAGLPSASERPAAPAFDGQILDGSSISLAKYRGKVVLVDFWATWCPPCRKSIPHLIEFQKEYGSKGLVVIGISLDQQGRQVVDPFVKGAGINYPIIVDSQGRLAIAYGGVQGIPCLFMIDRAGRLVKKIEGYVPRDQMEPAVKALLLES